MAAERWQETSDTCLSVVVLQIARQTVFSPDFLKCNTLRQQGVVLVTERSQ